MSRPRAVSRFLAAMPLQEREASAGATAAGTLDGAPHWVSGALAGVQAAVLSLLVVVMPGLAAYVATSADPSNAGIGWPRAVGVGTAVWLLGHGGPLRAGGATVSIVPLGITALAVFAGYASARRSAHPTRSSWLAGVAGYGLVVVLLTLLLGSAGPAGTGVGGALRTVAGGLVVAAVGLGAGTGRLAWLRRVAAPRWGRLPVPVRSGASGGLLVLALLLALSSVVMGWWVVSGRAAIGDVLTGLGVDPFGGVLLSVAQLALAPNLLLWGMAWLAGPGFSVGAGTLYSPGEVVSAPLPALPLLGALPTPAASGGLFAWAPVLVVAVGGVAGWWLHRELRVSRPWESAAACAVTASCAGGLSACATALAAGAAGPERLAVVGGAVLPVAAAVTALTLAGALLVAVPADGLVRAEVRAGTRRLRERLGGAGTGTGARSGTGAGPGTGRTGTSAGAAPDDGPVPGAAAGPGPG